MNKWKEETNSKPVYAPPSGPSPPSIPSPYSPAPGPHQPHTSAPHRTVYRATSLTHVLPARSPWSLPRVDPCESLRLSLIRLCWIQYNSLPTSASRSTLVRRSKVRFLARNVPVVRLAI
ncbi:hypothetical protein MSAN_01604400 [Mycena sanguinolenta]|uniref:Uncharacterized protein n=1 Tax=Mycena sanguinolenta TaxID=230812 RepID=A0A8H6Y4M9_9AGAR|nr:hypothetical protein MSAN_01604400 [Mycena sanguinolenta]